MYRSADVSFGNLFIDHVSIIDPDSLLRAIGKRNKELNKTALVTAKSLACAEEKSRSWIGSHSRRELESAKVQTKFNR